MSPFWFREPQFGWEPNGNREPLGTSLRDCGQIPARLLLIGSGNQREPKVAHRFPEFPPLKGGTGTSAVISGCPK